MILSSECTESTCEIFLFGETPIEIKKNSDTKLIRKHSRDLLSQEKPFYLFVARITDVFND